MSPAPRPLVTKERAVLCGALLLAVVLPAWLLLPPPPTDEPETASLQLSSLDLAEPADPADALAAPLFNPLRTEPTDQGENNTNPAAGVQAFAGPPVPVGIITSRKAGGLALIRGGSGETTMARAGDTVDGWTITAITQTAVTFRKGSEQQQLGLDYSNRESGDTPSDLSPSATPSTSSRMGS